MSTAASRAEVRRVTVSTYLGNTIEYYDFLLYGSAAATIFAPLFFADLDPVAGTIASFATLAIGYLARPLGGVVFGVLGDRIGRKPTLVLTMALMGVGSGLIGLLPTYAQAGWIAPTLLIALRLVQGIAVGGEWGGAALMAAEHAPAHRRGLITAIGQSGLPSGGLLSTLALAAVTALPPEDLFSWGWRIPFLVSFVLLVLGLYMRSRIAESPLFAELDQQQRISRRPARDLLRNPGALVRGSLAAVPPIVSGALFGSFAVSYAVGLGTPRATTLLGLAVTWTLSILLIPLYGRLADRYGRRPVYLGGVTGVAVLAYPVYLAIGSSSVPVMLLGFAGAAIPACATTAILATVLSEMFPTATRYTGMSLAYQASSVIGGLAPLIATSLLVLGGGGTQVGLVVAFVVLLMVAGGAAVLATAEGRGTDLATTGRATAGRNTVPRTEVVP